MVKLQRKTRKCLPQKLGWWFHVGEERVLIWEGTEGFWGAHNAPFINLGEHMSFDL